MRKVIGLALLLGCEPEFEREPSMYVPTGSGDGLYLYPETSISISTTKQTPDYFGSMKIERKSLPNEIPHVSCTFDEGVLVLYQQLHPNGSLLTQREDAHFMVDKNWNKQPGKVWSSRINECAYYQGLILNSKNI